MVSALADLGVRNGSISNHIALTIGIALLSRYNRTNTAHVLRHTKLMHDANGTHVRMGMARRSARKSIRALPGTAFPKVQRWRKAGVQYSSVSDDERLAALRKSLWLCTHLRIK